MKYILTIKNSLNIKKYNYIDKYLSIYKKMSTSIKYYPPEQPPNFKENLVNGKYCDPYFKNDDNSLFMDKESKIDTNFESELREDFEMEKDEKFTWNRIFSSEFFQDKKLKKSQIIEKEMKLNLNQGGIGNCYFIAYLHKLKEEMPNIFKEIIRD